MAPPQELDLVRTRFRLVLCALKVDSREAENPGCQQGFSSPTAAHRRRAALAQLLRAVFRAL